MKGRRSTAPGALELLEEAFSLLRSLPPSLYLRYYVGSFPFVLAFLYFWADMSHSAYAERRVVAASFGLALLYGWMKVWQADFGARLRIRLAGGAAPTFGGGPLPQVLVTQVGLQPLSFLVLPLAALAALPLGWTYAFFQSLSITGERVEARRQCALWPTQNHLLIGALWLFGLFVFLNLATGMLAIPSMLKSLLGVESEASRSLGAMLNTTFLAVASGLTYLAMGPVIKAAYAVRCFHGQALATGEDIEAQLRAFDRGRDRPEHTDRSSGSSPTNRTRAAALLLLAALAPGPLGSQLAPGPLGSQLAPGPLGSQLAPGPLGSQLAPGPLGSQPAPSPAGAVGVSPEELEASIDRVLSRPEFSWRLTRLRTGEEEKGWLTRSFARLARSLESLIEAVGRWIARVLRWFEEVLAPAEGERGSGLALSRLLTPRNLLLLGVALAAVIGLLLWRQRRRRPAAVAARPAAPAVLDLEADDAVAASLPADEWLVHARELIAAGDLRGATRALYLASLSRLAGLELLKLARFKSNLDYRRELERRARRWPRLVPLFADSSRLFERVWYGRHDATGELVERLSSNLEELEIDEAA